jgi:hypothetical protein
MATTATIASSATMQITNLDLASISQITGTLPRASLAQDDLQKYDLPLENFVVHDAPATKLPATAATDDFGCTGTTYGTNAIYLITLDEKANAGAHAVYGRTSYTLPPEYVAGQTLQIVVVAGANTTVAGTSMTVDVEACKVHATDGTVGADLVETAAQNCNHLTAAAKTFTLDPSGLSAGDKLDIRIAITTNDAATETAVKGVVNRAYLLADIKG